MSEQPFISPDEVEGHMLGASDAPLGASQAPSVDTVATGGEDEAPFRQW